MAGQVITSVAIYTIVSFLNFKTTNRKLTFNIKWCDVNWFVFEKKNSLKDLKDFKDFL